MLTLKSYTVFTILIQYTSALQTSNAGKNTNLVSTLNDKMNCDAIFYAMLF